MSYTKSKYTRFNICDAFVGLNILYLLQDIIYPPGIIAQSIQAIIIIWGFTYFLSLLWIFHRLPIVLKASTLLVTMYCIYGIIEIVFPHEYYVTTSTDAVRPHTYLQYGLNSLLPIFVFYRFYKEKMIGTSRIIIYSYIFIALFLLQYFHTLSAFRYNALINGSEKEEFTNNTGYNFVFFIPFLFFIKKPIIKFSLLSITAAFIIMSMKRGAILIGGFGIICFLIFQIKYAKSLVSRRAATFLSIIFIIIAVWYINDMMTNSDYFMQRIEQTKEGNSSHRDILYGELLHELNIDPSLIHFFFGRGANATVAIADNFAHQDWLELAVNNGLIGVVLGIYFYYSLFKTAFKRRYNLGNMNFSCFLVLSFMLLFKTMFSMSLTSMGIWVTLLIGYLTGCAERKGRHRYTKIPINDDKQSQADKSKITRSFFSLT